MQLYPRNTAIDGITLTMLQRAGQPRRFVRKDARTRVRRLAFGSQSNKTAEIIPIYPPSSDQYLLDRPMIEHLLERTGWDDAKRLAFLQAADKYHGLKS